jgi:hypothetical protein
MGNGQSRKRNHGVKSPPNDEHYNSPLISLYANIEESSSFTGKLSDYAWEIWDSNPPAIWVDCQRIGYHVFKFSVAMAKKDCIDQLIKLGWVYQRDDSVNGRSLFTWKKKS